MSCEKHTFDSVDVECASTLRLLAVDEIQKANSGHPGLPLGGPRIIHNVLNRFCRANPADPLWMNRDRFVLSGGHGSSLLYAYLLVAGYDFTVDDLKTFRQVGSKCPGHPEYNPKLGIEITTGPLGQGLAASIGMALAERIMNAHFGPEIINHRIWVMCGDGDIEEGVSHEAASLAGALGLENLVVLYDDNGISIDGPVSITMTDDTMKRFEAYGWDVRTCNGNDMAAVDEAIVEALKVPGKPHFIDCKTKIGLKSDWEGTAKVHGSPLGAEQLARVKTAYGSDPTLFFNVPEAVKARYAERAARGAKEEEAWKERVAAFSKEKPELYAVFKVLETRDAPLPAGWEKEGIPAFAADAPAAATRQWSQKVIEAFTKAIPSPLVVGGSADLTPSNLTRGSSCVDVARGMFKGNYIHYGIREHVMGQILNGLATYNIRPYAGTFLAFSDYMRPAIRAAALMGLPSIFEFTHDSIGHGEDGPTHHPVEHLLALRAIPNVNVIRPCDGNEVAAAWKYALERRNGPTILAFSRQGTPSCVSSEKAQAGLPHGAYVVETDDAVDVVLCASGTEVALAIQARKILAEEGVHARVVSMPCFEIFDAQPKEYRDSVLLPGVARVGIEAGRTIYTWDHYHVDAAMGVDRFGESGPAKAVYEFFGLTAAKIAAKAKEVIAEKKK